MREITYNCKFCGQQRVFNWTLSDLAMLDLTWEGWIKNLSCPRCCDFYKRKDKLTERIYNVCGALLGARQRTTGQLLTEMEKAAKLKLMQFAKEFTILVAQFYNQNADEIDIEPFWSALYTRPDVANVHIRAQNQAILSLQQNLTEQAFV